VGSNAYQVDIICYSTQAAEESPLIIYLHKNDRLQSVTITFTVPNLQGFTLFYTRISANFATCVCYVRLQWRLARDRSRYIL